MDYAVLLDESRHTEERYRSWQSAPCRLWRSSPSLSASRMRFRLTATANSSGGIEGERGVESARFRLFPALLIGIGFM